MNVAQIISDKRDGKELEAEQIESLVAGYVSDQVPDYQMSAFAMATYFQGMTQRETIALTWRNAGLGRPHAMVARHFQS